MVTKITIFVCKTLVNDGFAHKMTSPYSPESNRLAVGINQTLLNKVHMIMQEAVLENML